MPFWDTWDSINRSYVGQVDQKKLVEGAIDGMIKALGDPFSAYMSPDDLQRAREDLGGQFEGIGATIVARSTAAGGGSCPTLGADVPDVGRLHDRRVAGRSGGPPSGRRVHRRSTA